MKKDIFEEYMGRLENKIMARFDRYDTLLKLVNDKEPKMLDGENLLDNYDICKLLKISKRTLGRYRASKTLNKITTNPTINIIQKRAEQLHLIRRQNKAISYKITGFISQVPKHSTYKKITLKSI